MVPKNGYRSTQMIGCKSHESQDSVTVDFSQITSRDKSLQLLRDNQLFVKHSKCAFGAPEVEYLGHIVSQEGVQVDPKKVEGYARLAPSQNTEEIEGILRTYRLL
jgi:hypothetical protein